MALRVSRLARFFIFLSCHDHALAVFDVAETAAVSIIPYLLLGWQSFWGQKVTAIFIHNAGNLDVSRHCILDLLVNQIK